MKNILEICAGDIDSVRAAARGGAHRVELCSALALGGLTPSLGFINEAVKVNGLRVHVLIRPREGDFVYTPAEVAVMLSDIDAAARAGAHGVVIGALRPDGSIDLGSCQAMVNRAKAHGLSVTFHRAFDRVAEPLTALNQIIALGCDYLLTSGCAPSAWEGVEMLRQLHTEAANRITIIAAAGVNSANAAEILRRSGCTQIHASARAAVPSRMHFSRAGVAMGAADNETNRLTTNQEEVSKIIQSI